MCKRESDLYQFLRDEMVVREWGVRQLSQALGVRFGVAARWVAADPEKRVVPKPGTLVRIADELDLDIYDVFRHAGYLPAVNDASLDNHPHEAEIRLLLQRFRRILRNVPEAQWAVAGIIVATQLENIQVLLDRIEQTLNS